MNTIGCQVDVLAREQQGVVAGWQLKQAGWARRQIDAALRGMRRVHRDVCAVGDVSELGWYMAAALAMGPTGVVSHLSALSLMELRPYVPGDIHVSFTGGGRAGRPGLQLHRRTSMDVGTYKGIPVTSPTQSLRDADLEPHELYRALEAADQRRLPIHHQSLPLNAIVELQQATRGRTRSDAEALFLLLCHHQSLPIPRVNQRLNGFETDFHWPELSLVVEVDGFEHHRERPNFNSDRYRGLVHRAHGWEVIRISADHVYDQPELIVRALTLTAVA